MARAIMKGSVQFGLVNVPIKLYSAIEPAKTKFHQHHETDGGAIRHKKWCELCDTEVTQDEIIKGTQVDDKIVTVSTDELKQIRPEKTGWITIKEFVPRHEIESFYFSSHYYLGAEKKKDKTFFLFRDALRQCGRTAIGTFVMKEKEYVCAIEAYGNGLLLSTLHYNDEIRDINQIANIQEEPEISEQEMKLARQLIEQSSVDELDMSLFSDTFKAELENLIALKAQGETFVVPSVQKMPQPETNLVEMLKASVKAEA